MFNGIRHVFGRDSGEIKPPQEGPKTREQTTRESLEALHLTEAIYEQAKKLKDHPGAQHLQRKELANELFNAATRAWVYYDHVE